MILMKINKSLILVSLFCALGNFQGYAGGCYGQHSVAATSAFGAYDGCSYYCSGIIYGSSRCLRTCDAILEGSLNAAYDNFETCMASR